MFTQAHVLSTRFVCWKLVRRMPRSENDGFLFDQSIFLVLMEEIPEQYVVDLSWFEYVQIFVHLKCLAGFLPSRIFYLIVGLASWVKRYLSSTTWGSDKESWGMFFAHPKVESKTLGGTKILKESARFSDYGPPTLNATQKNDACLPSQKKCYFCIHLP